ncbi:1-aminocyclopropane-1-carboxylate synthase-like protein 1 [Saccoglossus kowalevskii]|uniref:1-aminocyclopropane-1-carboxylate synthase-like protein 1-like n=1 Tax=Saccoglossus kowalevskii TaxID=10224 RepID=A0ABM0N0H0_SACKO|nr:PREDICTED: 1-aminocyclopropane-1-carboxylate synthase-like protein 1-like [Saccoglossus kowalevskii]
MSKSEPEKGTQSPLCVVNHREHQCISKRAASMRRGLAGLGKKQHALNPYNKETNREGIVGLAIAENTLTHDVIAKKLSMIQSTFRLSVEILKNADAAGSKQFRETLAAFLTKYGGAVKPLNPDNLIIVNGGGSAVSMLSTVLCDPGDAFLIPTPFYSGIEPDCGRLAQVELVHADLTSQSGIGIQPFQLTVNTLEEGLLKAKKQGFIVRGIFLINPNNPLGDVYSKDLVMDCLIFAKSHKLHVIMDEIYMLSVFKEDVHFTSVMALEHLPDPDRTHMIWGFSKDFCMSGLRCACIYSWNDQVASSLKTIAEFHSVPTYLQSLLNEMILDKEWVTQIYIKLNHQRLKEFHSYMCKGLKDIGIKILEKPSGLFVWADFRQFINPSTFEGEFNLYNEFLDNKVYLLPGEGLFCCEPGWFRIIFSVSKDEIDQALERIATVINKRRSKEYIQSAISEISSINPKT